MKLLIVCVLMCLVAGELPSAVRIQAAVNKRFDGLFAKSQDGRRKPYVCVICDEVLMCKPEQCQVSLQTLKVVKPILSWSSFTDNRRTAELEAHYVASTGNSCDDALLKGMALSPRAVYYVKSGKGKVAGFSCCKRCKGCMSRKAIPRHSILNSNYVGAAPACLEELTEVELAFLTPLKHYGFCISWKGGKQTKLQGTLSFMRAKKRGIAKAVATLENMGFNENVIVLHSGKMTPWQKERASELSGVRTHRLIAALKWLCENHSKWKQVDYESMVKQLKEKKPVVCDGSTEVAGASSNIEEQEIFSCFYPDGATTPTTGGFEDSHSFKDYVKRMAEQGHDVEFQANLQDEFVRGDDPDILIDSCLLQFPCGIGGMTEECFLTVHSQLRVTWKNMLLIHLGTLKHAFRGPCFSLHNTVHCQNTGY